jgi:hypothetical protein
LGESHRTNGGVRGENRGFDGLVHPDHAEDAAFGGGFAWNLDGCDVFALVEELLGGRNRNPLAWGGAFTGFEILGIEVAIVLGFETQLHCGWRCFLNGGVKFRIGTRLDPEKSTDAETRNENEAGDERTQAPQVGLE